MKKISLTYAFMLIGSVLCAQQNDMSKGDPIRFYKGDIVISNINVKIILNENGVPDFTLF